jgi:hypothetical protein
MLIVLAAIKNRLNHPQMYPSPFKLTKYPNRNTLTSLLQTIIVPAAITATERQ